MSNRKNLLLIQALTVLFFFSSAVFAQDTTLVKLITALDTISDNNRKVDLWVRIADYTSENSVGEAKLYLDSAENLATSENYEFGIADLNRVRGSVFAMEGDYPSALKSLTLAQKKYRQLNDSSKLAKTYLLLGNIYSTTKNYTESLRYYRISAGLFQTLKDFKALAAINNNIGIIFWNLGELDSASIYYNKSLVTYLEFNDKESLAISYTNIGVIYAENNELEKAIDYYQKSNVTLKKLDRTFGQSINYLNIGDAYIQLKDYKKANENVAKAIGIAESDGYSSVLPDYYYTVGEIREAEGNYEEALKWYRKSEVLEDSLFNSATKSALVETQTGQLEDSQARELERIKQINESDLEAEKLKNTLLMVISSSILVLLLLATGYFYKSAKISKKVKAQNTQILTQKSKIYEQAKSIAEINESLLEKNAKLEGLSEEKDYIMNVVAHDLKSPLNQIQGLAEVIKLEEGNLTETQQECLSNISVSSERLSGMINRILSTRAVESENYDYRPQNLDLKPVLEQTIANFKPLADHKNITVNTIGNFEKTVAQVDMHYIRQVVENIISNSIKFSPLDKSVEIALYKKDKKAVLSFKDYGPGLSDADQKKLFTEYANLSAKPTGDESSTGLGLSIAKKYVDLMGGEIWCESEFGKGATFYLTFQLV